MISTNPLSHIKGKARKERGMRDYDADHLFNDDELLADGTLRQS
jgi:hypothetical protein